MVIPKISEQVSDKVSDEESTSELNDSSSTDENRHSEAIKRRLTRSAIFPATNAPSPELTTSSPDQKVLLNLRLDIGSSLAALFATTTPSTFSSLLSTSSPIFFSQYDPEPQTVEPTEPIEPSIATSNSVRTSQTTATIFSPNNSPLDGDVNDDSITTNDEVSDSGSHSTLMEAPTTKSPSDMDQAVLLDITTSISVLSSDTPNTQSSHAANNDSVNLELAKSHRETSMNINVAQNKLSQANSTKETQEISSSASLLPTIQSIQHQTLTSSIAPAAAAATTTRVKNASIGIVVASQLSKEQLRGQVLHGETPSESAPVNVSSAIVVPNLSSSKVTTNESSSNYGSNLGSMDTRNKTNPLTKMATSDPGSASHNGYNQQDYRFSTSLPPIALILSSGNNVTNLPFAHGKDGQNESIQEATPSEGAMFTISKETMTTPVSVNNQTPKSPAGAAVEIITTEIITSPLNAQTSAPSSIGTLTASNYEPGKSRDTQRVTLNQPLGPLDESSSTSTSKLSLVEWTSSTVVPSPESAKGDAAGTFTPLPTPLAHSGTKKPSVNEEAAFSTSNNNNNNLNNNNNNPIASSLPLVGKTSINGPLGAQDVHDSYNFKPVKEDDSVTVKRNDSSPPPFVPLTHDSESASSDQETIDPLTRSQTLNPHWSLWETIFECKNVKSSSVMADVLKNMKGYHFNNIILEDVELPSPFPFSLFSHFSFEFMEIMNVGSLQFSDNFSGKQRGYFYGRSNKGLVKSNSSAANPIKSTTSQSSFASSTDSMWKK